MKIKLLIQTLILGFLFTACTKTIYTNNDNTLTSTTFTSNKFFVLGSVEYVNNIQYIAKTSGNRSALSVIMNAVNKNGSELDNNDPNNILRFHQLVSSLVYKIGSVDMQMNYFRNKLNRVPKSLKELMLLNKRLPVNKQWRLLSIGSSAYHIQGTDGEYNLKFLSCDGYFEAVYNKKGILLDENNDPINMGTFNYAAGIRSINAHWTFDVSPYLIWGNTSNSPQKGKVAINKGVDLALSNYTTNSAGVYLYRQNLFGMQQGRVP
ncbi:MAG TPA: hypothetical protein VIK78_05820 [Ruminiclostridium sp.]